MSRVVLALLRKLFRQIVRFFKFFEYLNWGTLKEVGYLVFQQRLHGLSAEMAYQATLALFPGILALIAAVGLFESFLPSSFYQMARLFGELAPDEVRLTISSLIQQIIITPNQGVFSLSFLGSLWIFSGVLGAAMAALDQIHQVPIAKKRPFWQAKLVALSLAIGTLVLLIIASVTVLISDQIVEMLARQSCLLETVPECPLDKVGNCLFEPPVQNCLLQSKLRAAWPDWKWPLTLGIVSTAFAFVYRFGPTCRQKRTPIMPGAVLAAILWAILSSLFRLYVSHFNNYNLTYGAIGTFIILLLWLYLTSLVMLIGAQLNVTVGKAMRKKKK